MEGIDYERLEIFRLGQWVWQIHENQSYLGRTVFRLLRLETKSLRSCTPEEWKELHVCICRFEGLMDSLFAPDRYNYSQLGNTFSQLHVHAVPRYASQRTWLNARFVDKMWGKNWSPTPRSPLTMAETYRFADWLRPKILRSA